MPCEMNTPAEDRRIESARVARMKAKGDLATRLLCEVCEQIGFQDEAEWGGPVVDYPYFAMSEELEAWWENHQKEDRKREKDKEEAALEHELDRKRRVKRLRDEIATLEGEKNA